MSEDFIRDLELSFKTHTELLELRKGQLLEDLGEIDCKIVRLEEYILSNLNRHPELYDSYNFDDFYLNPNQ